MLQPSGEAQAELKNRGEVVPQPLAIYDVVSEETKFGMIRTHFLESLSALGPDHTEWREWDDYYLAKQWNTQRASWRPDPVVNYIAYIVDQKSPQITNSKPSGLILPRGMGDEVAASLFTKATDVIAERVNLDDKVTESTPTGLLLGTAWFKVYWDNSITGGSYSRKDIWKGDVAIDIPDPVNIYFDPAAVTVDDCRYIIYAVPKTVQWVYEIFKVRVDADNNFETEIYNRPSQNQSNGRVMVYEYWYRVNGTINCIYAANGKILKEIKKVYKHGRYPFVAFRPKKKRKSILGIGEPKNIINNQKLLNKLLEVPTTNALLTSNPIAIIDPMSGIDANKWTNKPGQIWKAKNPKDAVHWLTPPQLPTDLYKLVDLMTVYIEKMGGVYDSVTGNTPKGITAAAAIQMLMEQGSIPIKGIAKNLYAAVKDVYELMIELIKENYNETRYLRIEEQGKYQFVEFNAAKYAEIDFDVKVAAGATSPASEAYVSQLSKELFDAGLLLGSEYVDMQKNLPNKDRVVARLRQQEAAPPPAPVASVGQVPAAAPVAPMQPTGQPDFQTIYDNSPPELQQEISLMLEQGMSEEQIIEALMQLV